MPISCLYFSTSFTSSRLRFKTEQLIENLQYAQTFDLRTRQTIGIQRYRYLTSLRTRMGASPGDERENLSNFLSRAFIYYINRTCSTVKNIQ